MILLAKDLGGWNSTFHHVSLGIGIVTITVENPSGLRRVFSFEHLLFFTFGFNLGRSYA